MSQGPEASACAFQGGDISASHRPIRRGSTHMRMQKENDRACLGNCRGLVWLEYGVNRGR